MRKFLKYFFIILIVITSEGKQSPAQQSKIDSLLTILKTDKEDSNKVHHLNNLSSEYFKIGGYDSALHYCNITSQLAQQLNFKKGIAESFNNIAAVYYLQGDYPQALAYWLKALNIDKELKDKRGMAKRLGNIGIVYVNQSDYSKALDYYFKALKMAEEIKDKKGIETDLGNIGNVYYYQKDYPKVLNYYLKALKIAEEIKDKTGIMRHLGNLGGVYDNLGNYSKALACYFKSLKMAEQFEDKNGIATMLGNIGVIYQERAGELSFDKVGTDSLYKKALNYHFQALKIKEELEDKNEIAITLDNIGSLYTKTEKYNKAYIYLYRALAIDDSIGATDGMKDDYYSLSTLYEKSNIPLHDTLGGNLLNMESMRLRALYYHKRYITIRDTLFSEENKKQLVRKEMNFEFDKKEAEAKAEQEKQSAVAAAESRKQLIILALVSCFLVLVLILASFIFRSLRITRKQKRLIEKQKERVEEHQKDILDSIYYARRIQTALLPTEKYITKHLRN